jgi:hypothetical protein
LCKEAERKEDNAMKITDFGMRFETYILWIRRLAHSAFNRTIYSLVPKVGTVTFTIKQFHVLPTQCVYVLRYKR